MKIQHFVVLLVAVGALSACTSEETPKSAECEPGFFGSTCAPCECAANATCNDGADNDGTCTCAAGTYGADCSDTCACDLGGLCDDGATGTGTCTNDYAWDIEFTRLTTSVPNPFRATATLTNHDTPVPGVSPTVTASRGTASAVTDLGAGVYTFDVDPGGTGEHAIEVSYAGASITRTPVVLGGVHPDWGQPLSVEGLVNTEGWEDGATITPDGEYLFVHYLPVYFSGVFLFNTPRANGGCGGNRLSPTRCTHPWLDDVIGPIGVPERPGFPVGRISADGTTYLHNANAYGVGIEGAPTLAVSSYFFGFKRQPDGSFAEPFAWGFDDLEDGLIGPSGLSFVMQPDGTATVAFSLDDPADADMVDLDNNGTDDAPSRDDIFTVDLPLGTPAVLGTYVSSGGAPGAPPERSTPFPSTLVNFGKSGIDGIAGAQGNPHLHAPGGTVQAVFTDDEKDGDADTGDLTVFVLESGNYPEGVWSKTVLPSPVNAPAPSDEIQPFLDSNGLYYTRLGDGLPMIRYVSYSGTNDVGEYANGANWGTPEDILVASSSSGLGEVFAIGEPTTTTRDGVEYLYFVYVIVRDTDATTGLPDLDLQVGYVTRDGN